MSEKENEGFVRQRRNLMVVSLVLLFSEATELKFEKINVFGTELLVNQPYAVNAALWFAAIYWLWRFYQYSRLAYEGSLQRVIQDYIFKFDVLWPVIQKELHKSDPKLIEPIEDLMETPMLECTQYGSLQYMPKYVEAEVSISKVVNTKQRMASQGIGSRKVRVKGSELFRLRVRSWINLIVHTTLFTELLLPYFVFSLPVLYIIYKNF